MVFADPSETEVRQRATGQTTEGRYVFLVFTILGSIFDPGDQRPTYA